MAIDIHFHQSLGSTGHGQNSFVYALPAHSAIAGQAPGEINIPEGANFAHIMPDATHTLYVYDKSTTGTPTDLRYKHLTPLAAGSAVSIKVPSGGRLNLV